MSWLSFLTGGASTLIDSLGNAIDKNITSDEERGKLRNELVKLQQDFLLKAYEFESKNAETTAKDRETARQREVELAKAGQKNYMLYFLAGLAILLMSGLTFYILKNDVPQGIRDMVMMIVGAVLAIVKDIYGYYFGSSYGSTLKNEIINKMK